MSVPRRASTHPWFVLEAGILVRRRKRRQGAYGGSTHVVLLIVGMQDPEMPLRRILVTSPVFDGLPLPPFFRLSADSKATGKGAIASSGGRQQPQRDLDQRAWSEEAGSAPGGVWNGSDVPCPLSDLQYRRRTSYVLCFWTSGNGGAGLTSEW